MSQEKDISLNQRTGLLLAGGFLVVVVALIAALAGGILLNRLIFPSTTGNPPAGQGAQPAAADDSAAATLRPAPAFILDDLDGQAVSLADFRGQPVVINFWATWCVPCEVEMPLIQAAYEAHQEAGLVVLAIDYLEHPDTVRSFISYYEFTFTVLHDRDGAVADDYQVQGLPTTFFVDRGGSIAHLHVGEMSEADLEFGLAKIR